VFRLVVKPSSYPFEFECPTVNIRRLPPSSCHFLFHNPGYFPKHVVINISFGVASLPAAVRAFWNRTVRLRFGFIFLQAYSIAYDRYFDISIVKISKVFTECPSYVVSISVSET